MGRRLGIIVGANSYQDPAFRPLQYAENDTRALAQWLVNTKGGNWAPSMYNTCRTHMPHANWWNHLSPRRAHMSPARVTFSLFILPGMPFWMRRAARDTWH